MQKLFGHKRAVDLVDLERPFTIEEIKRAVFDLGGGGIRLRGRMVSPYVSLSKIGVRFVRIFSGFVMISIRIMLIWRRLTGLILF